MENSAVVSCWPRTMSVVAVCPRRLAGSLKAPFRSWLSRTVAGLKSPFVRDRAPGRPLVNDLVGDQHRHRGSFSLDAVPVAIQVHENRGPREHRGQGGDRERAAPARCQLLCDLHLDMPPLGVGATNVVVCRRAAQAGVPPPQPGALGDDAAAAQHAPVPPLPAAYFVGGVSSRIVELPVTLIEAGLPPPKNVLMRPLTIGTPVL